MPKMCLFFVCFKKWNMCNFRFSVCLMCVLLTNTESAKGMCVTTAVDVVLLFLSILRSSALLTAQRYQWPHKDTHIKSLKANKTTDEKCLSFKERSELVIWASSVSHTSFFSKPPSLPPSLLALPPPLSETKLLSVLNFQTLSIVCSELLCFSLTSYQTSFLSLFPAVVITHLTGSPVDKSENC